MAACRLEAFYDPKFPHCFEIGPPAYLGKLYSGRRRVRLFGFRTSLVQSAFLRNPGNTSKRASDRGRSPRRRDLFREISQSNTHPAKSDEGSLADPSSENLGGTLKSGLVHQVQGF